MAKTRQMQRISNTNHARTRAGKAQARAQVTPSTLVMESVTIAAPCRRRNPRQDPIDVPPAPPPSTSPTGVILKEGWALLKAYFENNSAVSADTVHDFLAKVDDSTEAQLRPMFGQIMGLEPGDPEAKEALRKEIDLQLASLPTKARAAIRAPRGKGRAVKGQRVRTTFRPSFLQEDSASRPSSNVVASRQVSLPPNSPPHTPPNQWESRASLSPELTPHPSTNPNILPSKPLMQTWYQELLLEQAMASTVDTETASAIEERMSEYLEAVETSTLPKETREALIVS